ncbi:aggrecan core protein-like protein, partial [Leptotrombidium deliense]
VWIDYPCKGTESVICEITLKNDEEIITTRTTLNEYECEARWLRFENKCFITNTTEVTRDKNENYCKSLNASLVSINSDDENNFLASRLIDVAYWTAVQRVKVNDSILEWTDGTELNNTNWILQKLYKPTCLVKEACIAFINGKYYCTYWDLKHSQLCSKPAKFREVKNTSNHTINGKHLKEQLKEMKSEIVHLMQTIHTKPKHLFQANTSRNAHLSKETDSNVY